MTDTFWCLIGSLDLELVSSVSLIKGAMCIREHEADADVEMDLLSLAEEQMKASRELLKEIEKEYRKLEKEKKGSAPPTQTDQST